MFGNSDVETGETLACFCLFYCRLCCHELIPNFDDQFLLITFLCSEAGARNPGSSLGRSLHSSARQLLSEFSVSTKLMFIRITKESKTRALRSTPAVSLLSPAHPAEILIQISAFSRRYILPMAYGWGKLVSQRVGSEV